MCRVFALMLTRLIVVEVCRRHHHCGRDWILYTICQLLSSMVLYHQKPSSASPCIRPMWDLFYNRKKPSNGSLQVEFPFFVKVDSFECLFEIINCLSELASTDATISKMPYKRRINQKWFVIAPLRYSLQICSLMWRKRIFLEYSMTTECHEMNAPYLQTHAHSAALGIFWALPDAHTRKLLSALFSCFINFGRPTRLTQTHAHTSHHRHGLVWLKETHKIRHKRSTKIERERRMHVCKCVFVCVYL